MLTIVLKNLLLILAIAAVIIVIVKFAKTNNNAPKQSPGDAPEKIAPAVPRSLIVAWVGNGIITLVLLGAGTILIIADLANRGDFMDGFAASLGTWLVMATLVASIPTAISIFMRHARVLIRMVLALVLPVLVVITVFDWFLF